MGSTGLSRRDFLARIGLASAGGVALAVAGGSGMSAGGVATAAPLLLPEMEPTGRTVEYVPEPGDFALGTGWRATRLHLDWDHTMEEMSYMGSSVNEIVPLRSFVRLDMSAVFVGSDEQLAAFMAQLRTSRPYGPRGQSMSMHRGGRIRRSEEW